MASRSSSRFIYDSVIRRQIVRHASAELIGPDDIFILYAWWTEKLSKSLPPPISPGRVADMNDGAVLIAVFVQNARPIRVPDIFNGRDWLWELVEECWCRDPARRLYIGRVLDRIIQHL